MFKRNSLILKSCNRIPRLFLKLIFGFDLWHIAPSHEKKYINCIVDYVDRNNFNTIVEIGCGLGDVLRRVKKGRRIGLDCDRRVINAAKFIEIINPVANNKIQYQTFDFFTDKVNIKCDLLIMCNWIHAVPALLLKPKLEEILKSALTESGVIIIDTVNNPKYQYCHENILNNSQLPIQIRLLGVFEAGRKIYAIEKVS